MDKRRVVAVTGKGGTGKTALVAIMVKILTQKNGLEVLVIDADSAVSLPQTLGIDAEKTVSDIREEVITDPEVKRRIAQTHISKIIKTLIKHQNNTNLLVMGRPEAAGCFCTVNDLLKYGIETIAKDYLITVIDCEAGPEQINRRVIENVDTLIIVTDTSARGFKTANSIYQIAKSGAIKGSWEVGLVINRLDAKDSEKLTLQASDQMTIRILGYIPDDKNITDYDLTGKPLLELPDDSPSVMAVEEILGKMGLGS